MGLWINFIDALHKGTFCLDIRLLLSNKIMQLSTREEKKASCYVKLKWSKIKLNTFLLIWLKSVKGGGATLLVSWESGRQSPSETVPDGQTATSDDCSACHFLPKGPGAHGAWQEGTTSKFHCTDLQQLYNAVSSSIVSLQSPWFGAFYKVSAWQQRRSACPPSLIGHLQAVNSQYSPVMKGMLKEPWGWF